MGDSNIQWTNKTLNPIRARNILTGDVGWFCEHVSRGCGVPGKGGCYAEKMNMNTYFGNGLPYKASSLSKLELFLDPKILMQPLHWRAPKKVFMCSMTDLFGRFVKDAWLDQIFTMMALAPQHTFQILTKRPERMRDYMQRLAKSVNPLEEVARAWGYTFKYNDIPLLPWPIPNVWLGVSCEDQKSADERVPLLIQTPADVRFISYEPAVGMVDFSAFLPHNLVHEAKEQRREDIPFSGDGARDRRDGADMAHSGTPRGPLERRIALDPLQTETSGERYGGLSSDRNDDRREGSEHLRASARLQTLQGTDSRRANSQPRGRQEETQPPGQSDVGDVFGANAPRLPNRAKRRTRREESRRKTVRPGSTGDSSGIRQGSDDPSRPRDETRSPTPASFKNREGRPSTKPGWPHSRLHAPKTARQCNQRSRWAISLIISGGESGPKAEPSHPDWHRATRDFCVSNGIAYFFKQWGEWAEELFIDEHDAIPFDRRFAFADNKTMVRVGKKAAGRLLDGREWNEFPK